MTQISDENLKKIKETVVELQACSMLGLEAS